MEGLLHIKRVPSLEDLWNDFYLWKANERSSVYERPKKYLNLEILEGLLPVGDYEKNFYQWNNYIRSSAYGIPIKDLKSIDGL